MIPNNNTVTNTIHRNSHRNKDFLAKLSIKFCAVSILN